MPKRPARPLGAYTVIVAVIIAALAVVTLSGFVWTRKSVTVVVDGRALAYRTQAATVSALLADAGIEVGERDIVSPAASAVIADGDSVVVRHAVPVTLVLGGERLALKVVGTSVGDALVAAGLDPTSGMKVSPEIGAPLKTGMTITATDVFLRVVQQELPVPPKERVVVDPSMPINTKRIVSHGEPGKLLRVLETLVTGGREGGKVLKAERVVKEPVDVIIAVGTKSDFRPATRSGFGPHMASAMPAPENGKRMNVVATAYLPKNTRLEGGFHAATGARLGYGIIAVDPDVIPLGTRIWVPGYGYGVAADTGGAIKGNHIDLCFDTAGEMDDWGVQELEIVLLP